jgi:hypothetical protein
MSATQPEFTIEAKPEVTVESYLVGWDGRRRARFVKWYRVLVDGVCVASGLKEKHANRLAEKMR